MHLFLFIFRALKNTQAKLRTQQQQQQQQDVSVLHVKHFAAFIIDFSSNYLQAGPAGFLKSFF